MSKKFKEIKEGDKLYCVEPSFDKCEIKIYTVKEVGEPINNKEIFLYFKEKPNPTFVPKDSTSYLDLLFTSKDDATKGMIKQINHSIDFHKGIIKKYKEQLKKFEK